MKTVDKGARVKRTRLSILGMFLGLCVACTASPAHADAVCSTPDGFIYQDGRLQNTGGNGGSGGKGIGGTGQRAANTKGIGGTGSKVAEGKGIGGTGNKVAEGNGKGGGKGIGGTGAKIAMRGTITGFASICVNGAEVHYDDKTPMSIGGKDITADELKVGQVVSVIADPAPQGGYVAREIDVAPGLVGPVEAVQPNAGLIRVMGQDVRMTPTGGAMPVLGAGDVVRVSGMRDAGNVVVATLVEKVAPDTPAQAALAGRLDVAAGERVSLEGYVHGVSGENILQIDGHNVALPDGERDDYAPNMRVFVYGVPDAAGLIHAETIAVEERIVPTNLPEIQVPHRDGGDRLEREGHDEHGAGEHEDEFEDNEHDGIEQEELENEEPEIEGHEIEGPEIEEPEVEGPEIEAPEIESPEIEAPEIEVPEIETPEIETPEIEVPEIEVPEVEAPEVEVPEIEAPELE